MSGCGPICLMGADGIEQPVVWNFGGAVITHPGIPT